MFTSRLPHAHDSIVLIIITISHGASEVTALRRCTSYYLWHLAAAARWLACSSVALLQPSRTGSTIASTIVDFSHFWFDLL